VRSRLSPYPLSRLASRAVLSAVLLLTACGPRRIPLAHTEEKDGRRYVTGEAKPFTGVLVVAAEPPQQIAVDMPYHDGVRDGHAEGKYQSGKQAFRETWVQGLRQGVREEWDSAGHLSRTQTFVDGKLEGVMKDFTPTGVVITERPMHAGEEQGLLRTYYPSGKPRSEGEYQAGRLEGRLTIWYENGQKKYEGVFAAGKPNGVVSEWFEDGKDKARTTWKVGVADGPFTRWYPSGQKQLEGRYRGIEQLDLKGWSEDGKPISPMKDRIPALDDPASPHGHLPT
jgi:uncharacterized protein